MPLGGHILKDLGHKFSMPGLQKQYKPKKPKFIVALSDQRLAAEKLHSR